MRPKPPSVVVAAILAIASSPARAADAAPRLELRLLASAVQATPQRYSSVSDPVFSPDGGARIMYGVRGTGHIIQRRTEDLAVVRDVDAGIRYMNWVDWLEDGRVFACGYGAKVWTPGFERITAGWEEGTGFSVTRGYHRAGEVLAQFVGGSSSNRRIIPGWIELRGLRADVINKRSKFDRESVNGDLSTDRAGGRGGLSPDGRHAVVVFDGDHRVLGIWKPFSRLVSYTVPGLEPVAVRDFKPGEQTPSGEDFVFAPDAGRVALRMTDPDGVAVYAVPGLERLASLPCGKFCAPRGFSPDGRLLAVTRELDDKNRSDELKILDGQAGWSVVVSTVAFDLTSARFSPDGRRLVTTGAASRWDGKSGVINELIRIWDLKEPETPAAASPAAAPFSGAVPLLR